MSDEKTLVVGLVVIVAVIGILGLFMTGTFSFPDFSQAGQASHGARKVNIDYGATTPSWVPPATPAGTCRKIDTTGKCKGGTQLLYTAGKVTGCISPSDAMTRQIHYCQ